MNATVRITSYTPNKEGQGNATYEKVKDLIDVWSIEGNYLQAYVPESSVNDLNERLLEKKLKIVRDRHAKVYHIVDSAPDPYEALTNQGFVVLPLLRPHEVAETREQLAAELARDPVYKDASLALQQGMVMGGFGALPTAHSYHNNLTRNLRILAHHKMTSLPGLSGKKITQCPDRVMVRTANQLPSKESWHRDKSPYAQEGSDMFGGWINLNDFAEHFVCCPGSQQVGNAGAQNFETISKEQRPYWKSRQVEVPVPPGHMIVFYENIVHCVNPGKRTNRVRLFTGWCIGPSTPDPTLISRMKSFQTPKIKGGMQPPMYSRQHMACWMDRIVKFSENIKDEYCYHHTAKSGKNEGKTFRIAQRFPMQPGTQYTPYTDAELSMFTPQTC